MKTEDVENRNVLRKKIAETNELSEEKLMILTSVFCADEPTT